MDEVQFGILACSGIAQRRFLPALKLAHGARLGRIGSRDPVKAQRFAQQFGAPRHGTYEEVLADPQINAVYISTPPNLHAQWVHKAAAAGKHVLCEKPAFVNGHEAHKAVDACRAAGVRLMEAYVPPYHPQHAKVREFIAEGRIGTPKFFEAQFIYPRPANPDDIRFRPELLGGVFHDSAGYPVVFALMHMPGNPLLIHCLQSRDAASGVDDACAITLQFSGGAIAQMYAGFGVQYRSRYAVSGVNGRIEVERAFAVAPDMKTTVALETNHGTEKVILGPSDQFRLMIEDFIAQIRAEISSERPAKNYEADLLRLQGIMDAAAQSARERRAVEIKDL